MPGILPMKVIKVGGNAQTRIAQACDRCRSKKIRCDGIRPSCTQCVNVGFECKTSDKLSRRAFPRGYTESLEERVRALELEVRELKELLDEKDEKIDMLSRMHSNSPQPNPRRKSSVAVSTPATSTEGNSSEEKDDYFRIMQSTCLVDDEDTDAYFMGTSSSNLLIDAYKTKSQEQGKPSAEFSPKAFLPATTKSCGSTIRPQAVEFQAPARMISDQLINIFFQEWAPLFPILHRPTFLSIYEEYVSCPEAMTDKTALAQLNLVFAIAALSSDAPFYHEIESFNAQWQSALDQFLMDNSLPTLQCLLLAQIASMQNGDYTRLLKFKGLAVSLSQRLGLHQSQKRFVLGTLTSETRKKLFWTLYTLDCFTASQLGQPRLLKEEDIHCEYPVDADDEYITEKGFLPTLPGEFTKLSSALALFKVSRILAKVLSENYPASASHELSFRKILALSDELDEWSKNLAQHLRLQFIQDKPSTNMISSRSPIVSLAYHYIRSLIYRPAVCASSMIGHMSGSAKVSLADSSKHIVQIVQLLTERSLSFAFCLNKNELLIAAGFGLLFQNLDLERGSGLMKENSRLTFVIATVLDRQPSRASVEFRRIITTLAIHQSTSSERRQTPPALSRHNSDGNLSNSSHDTMSSAQKHIRAIMSRFSSSTKAIRPDERRATLPIVNFAGSNNSQTSLSSVRSEPHVARSEPPLSPHNQRSSLSPPKRSSKSRATNLDYLPLGSNGNITPAYRYSANLHRDSKGINLTDWERLLSSLDNGQTNIYDGIYGGPAIDALAGVSPLPQSADSHLVWSPDVMAFANDGMNAAPQSVLSFSDESLTSGEEFAELTNCTSNESYRGILIPEMSPGSNDGFGLSGLDGGFGL